MVGYFSFDRFITRQFVKALYLLGFVVLTIGGISLAVWAGLSLHDAAIPRQMGWRYFAAGIASVILGNLLWRIFCEFWIVLFNMHARLVSIDYSLHEVQWQSLGHSMELAASPETDTPVEAGRPATESYGSPRPASVLGLT